MSVLSTVKQKMGQTSESIPVLRSVCSLREYLRDVASGSSLGFVATMGALHAGHIALIERSVIENEITVVSIFVNPTQFAPNEDLSTYPRDEASDLQHCRNANASAVFIPSVDEVYPADHDTWVITGVGNADRNDRAEGNSRPTFFRGVATVVAKLLVLIKPTKTYFGQKDAQQCAVIRRLIKDLWLNVELVVCETVREQDGLAMSSRNVYLTSEQRSRAPIIWKALCSARDLVRDGQVNAEELRSMIANLLSEGGVAPLYIGVCKRWTMREVNKIEGECIISVAAMVGKARLIDNVVVTR